MKIGPNDLELLARTIYGEARGESFEGKVAVGWVIRNRVENPAWWGKTLPEVCLKPKQFSCWDDANRITMWLADPADKQYRLCLMAALAVLDATIADSTAGADHYHSTAVFPTWAAGKTPVATIGSHHFYKLRT